MTSLFGATASAAANAMEGAAIGRALGDARDAAEDAQYEAEQLKHYALQLEAELAKNGIKSLERPNLHRRTSSTALTKQEFKYVLILILIVAALIALTVGYLVIQSAVRQHRAKNLMAEMSGVWLGSVQCQGTGPRQLRINFQVSPTLDDWGRLSEFQSPNVYGYFEFIPALPRDKGRMGMDNYFNVGMKPNGEFVWPRAYGTSKYAMSGKFDMKTATLHAVVEGCTALSGKKSAEK